MYRFVHTINLDDLSYQVIIQNAESKTGMFIDVLKNYV